MYTFTPKRSILRYPSPKAESHSYLALYSTVALHFIHISWLHSRGGEREMERTIGWTGYAQERDKCDVWPDATYKDVHYLHTNKLIHRTAPCRPCRCYMFIRNGYVNYINHIKISVHVSKLCKCEGKNI